MGWTDIPAVIFDGTDEEAALWQIAENVHRAELDDPRLAPQRAQVPADEVRAQVSFHADDARRQLLECVFETQSLDLAAEGDLPVNARLLDELA